MSTSRSSDGYYPKLPVRGFHLVRIDEVAASLSDYDPDTSLKMGRRETAMKRSRLLWAVALFGIAIGAAVGLGTGGTDAHANRDAAVEGNFTPAAVVDYCDDVCVRGRGAAALIVFSQWPSP